ncbi:alanine racemase [Pontibacter sp. JAM-7]|uniref:alanine racemase n=1 Tax=Pontibacter sp. JAM-7 TaxID=3366581 RepID=UPI003AF4D069
MSRAATAIIHLDAICQNYRLAKQIGQGRGTLAVVKANAYGHGAAQVAHKLHNEADAYAVACIEEALELRQSGITKPILLLEGFFTPDEIPLISEHQFWCALHCQEQLDMLARTPLPTPLSVWLKLDTGMHRLGFRSDQILNRYPEITRLSQVKDVTLMTHLACADELSSPMTGKQITELRRLEQQLKLPSSIANSAGVLAHPDSLSDWQRPGIMLYGASPFAMAETLPYTLHTTMTLQSEIIAIHDLQPGDSVGYGATWVCDRPMRVGTVAMGYADGYPRHAGNGTPVWVAGQQSQLVGRVSMDMLTVDITGRDDVGLGAPVELWGKHVNAGTVAEHAGTIPYTLFTGVTARVKKRYQD